MQKRFDNSDRNGKGTAVIKTSTEKGESCRTDTDSITYYNKVCGNKDNMIGIKTHKQLDKTTSPETDPHIHRRRIFHKGTTVIQSPRTVLSSKWLQSNWMFTCKNQ